MFILLYVMCMMAVSAGGGPLEVDAAYPLADVTEMPHLNFIRFRGIGDSLLEEEEEEEEEVPYFDASMSSTYTAYLGKTATLTCVVHAARSDKSVSWIRGRDLRILTVGGYTYTTDLRFEALHQKASSEWTLRIKSVQLRDQGSYECQITTKPIRTFNVFLKVVEPTVEVIGAPDIYVNTASMINLTCVVNHAPYPPEAITWFHGNQTISYTSKRGGVSVVEERGETTTSILLLQNARASDSGAFTCQPEGMESAQVTLHVLDGERPAAMQTNSSSVSTSRLSAIFMVATIATIAVF
ncbi:zwei Ig domain protein zig-8-like [Penaeus chinensis]|uniref:zwei Ig domain protein zig-8-like n=1 Tax=Penaeus chinensis TaxID=139456 RepID=UPI001FB82959|nr:zwei Ig domain protein zig-8-like [Penaeus chinensis]XP_047485415.1 zwei Ig domain protein zig-8-like [Penaeus chinensis]